MLDQLARVTRAIVTAAERRADAPAALGDVVALLQQSHPDPGPGDDHRFAALQARFGLSDRAADLLAIALAPSLDPAVGLAVDLLAGRDLHGRITTALALELAGIGTATADSSRLLQPNAALRRSGLVEIEGGGGWLDRTLVVADRVRGHLVGDDTPDPDVSAALVDVIAFRGAPAQELAGAVAGGQDLIWVHGRPGTAGTSVAAAALDLAGLPCLVVDARLMAVDERATTVRQSALEAALRGGGLVVSGADLLLEQRATVTALTTSPVPVIAVGTRNWPPHLTAVAPLSVGAPMPTVEDRSAIWTSALADHVVDPRSVAALRFGPEEILATARSARLLAQAKGGPVTDEILQDAARQVGAAGAATASTVGHVTHHGVRLSSFDDLVLPDRVSAELTRLVAWARHRHEIVSSSAFLTKGGKGGGLAALFTGSPGTGKTLAAHVVSDELGLELLQIDLSAVVDKYIGETEKNLEKVFRAAESRNVVLFFDEADALFGSRSSVQDAHDRYANQEVSYLLQRMEHFDGITLLATNLRGNLDKAFQRRMQFIVHFPDPDAETRLNLWQQHLRQTGPQDPQDPVDVAGLAATLELAGGDIRNIVLAAGYDAAVAGRSIGQALVVAAAEREFVKLGRRSPLPG